MKKLQQALSNMFFKIHFWKLMFNKQDFFDAIHKHANVLRTDSVELLVDRAKHGQYVDGVYRLFSSGNGGFKTVYIVCYTDVIVLHLHHPEWFYLKSFHGKVTYPKTVNQVINQLIEDTGYNILQILPAKV